MFPMQTQIARPPVQHCKRTAHSQITQRSSSLSSFSRRPARKRHSQDQSNTSAQYKHFVKWATMVKPFEESAKRSEAAETPPKSHITFWLTANRHPKRYFWALSKCFHTISHAPWLDTPAETQADLSLKGRDFACQCATGNTFTCSSTEKWFSIASQKWFHL